ncbi:hypothetical protein HNP84_000430 [Thermocatellispora tengchongensis]|uniref:Uncharacterized protein n=1 Tax=Thermocatellispora tengchongensis TaxID=1073253 RepID=A0A840NU09_9ACTN|nr:DUF6463 family protein [Thermocatellispora tengchongensis]MBB5130742.1 hypothetical protein [Thermocatellispora tengchongensis]
MNSTKRLLRWASGIMLVLGIGHPTLLALVAWDDISGWVDRGIWAAVPLVLADEGAARTAEFLQNEVTFWAGPGSFAVPLILLGCLTWHLAGRGVAVPAAIGWGLAAWCAVGGVLLVPSPFFAGIVAGALIIVAARQKDRPRASARRRLDA